MPKFKHQVSVTIRVHTFQLLLRNDSAAIMTRITCTLSLPKKTSISIVCGLMLRAQVLKSNQLGVSLCSITLHNCDSEQAPQLASQNISFPYLCNRDINNNNIIATWGLLHDTICGKHSAQSLVHSIYKLILLSKPEKIDQKNKHSL